MKLTPLDIRHREFRKALRGYAEEEVDVFLDDVADEFERVFQDNMELQDRIQILEDQVGGYEGLKDTLSKTLVSAQQQADGTRANAHKEAELILRDAGLKARDIVGEAYSEKQKVQQNLTQLRQIEEDFRFKFRSLLEAHLNLLVESPPAAAPPALADSSAAPARVGTATKAPEAAAPSTAPTETEADAMFPFEPPAEPDSLHTPAVAVPMETHVPAADSAAVAGEPDLSGYLERLPADGAAPETIDGDEASDDTKGSSVRRFLFGKRDVSEPEESGGRQDRDFEW